MRNFYFLKPGIAAKTSFTLLFAMLFWLLVPNDVYSATYFQKEQLISVDCNDVPLASVLKTIEEQSTYTFFYSSDLIKEKGNVSVSLKDAGIKDVLDAVMVPKGLDYEFIGRKILIKDAADKSAGSKPEKNDQKKQSKPVAAASDQTGKEPAGHTVRNQLRNIVVRGVVKDDSGNPLPGVGVMVKGTLVGTVTANDGSFRLKVSNNDELSFSMLGFKTTDMYVGSRTFFNVTLKTEVQAIDEVVVTALGLKRSEKSLGYAATKVNGEQFATSVTSTNWLSGLTGQVAGLTLQRTGAGAGGSMRVTLRGESSLDLGNNGALFVIDGVPMFNTSYASGDSSVLAIDYGDGTGDINPDDIENITVLKGPAATALYGSEAANGAIVITTKMSDGGEGKVSATFTSNFVAHSVNTEPDLQYVYGQGGTDGHYSFHYGEPIEGEVTTTSDHSWGPKMDGTLYYQYYDVQRGIGVDENGNRIKTPFVSYGNWFKDFFQTGWTATNSLSVSANINKNNSVRISLSDSRSEDITPNCPSTRQTIKFNSRSAATKWMTVSSSFTYYRRDNKNLPMMGYGSTSVMYSLWGMAPNMDMNWARRYWMYGMEGIQQDATLMGKNNPYFSVYECLNTLDRDRFYGNLTVDLNLYKGLDLMIRGGVDTSHDFRTSRQPKSSYSNRYGMYSETDVYSMQASGDFLLKYSRNLGSGFRMRLNFGGSIVKRNFSNTYKKADQLKQPGIYSLSNSVERIRTTSYAYERQTNSLYGMAQFSWRDAVYLDLTGRNDWSSTLPVHNNSYFYPSVSTSILFNELFDFGSMHNVFNLVKLRASVAQVGHDTAPFRTTDYLASTDFPGTYLVPKTLNNKDLRPEMVLSWELGLDLRMFRNRLNIDVAYYDNKTKDLIVSMPVSAASGVQYRYANAGTIKNYGWEVQVKGTLIKTRNTQWTAYVNWSRNRNRVLDLGDGIDSWIVASYSSYAYMTAYEGGTLSAMYGLAYKRAPKGSYIIESDGRAVDVSGKLVVDENGYPQYTDAVEYIGECLPDWKGGFGTSVRWKGLTVSIAFDGQKGGNVYSYTSSVMGSRGKSKATLPGRYGGLVVDGVNQLPDGNYTYNKTKTTDIVEYYGICYARQNCEQNFLSTEFLKLREVRINYDFPRKLMEKTRFIKKLSISIWGRDLYCWSQFPAWDPEGAFMRGASIVPGFEMLQMPGTATYGGSIKITF